MVSSSAFQDLPAEAISRADVYKSAGANLVEGGVAGAIDLKLRKPMEFRKGLTLVVNGRASTGDFIRLLANNLYAIDEGFAGLHRVVGVSGQDFGEGAFTRTVRSHNGVDFTGFNFEIQPFQNGLFFNAGFNNHTQVTTADSYRPICAKCLKAEGFIRSNFRLKRKAIFFFNFFCYSAFNVG